MKDELRKVPDEGRENMADTLEGEISDDELEAVAGGTNEQKTRQAGVIPGVHNDVTRVRIR